MYPLLLKPIYKETIWGGGRLRNLPIREVPSGNIGESWDISCGNGAFCVIENGILSGKSFSEVIFSNPAKYLGENIKDFGYFPLLVKLIDAADDLSVQVHPGDDYNGENSRGKSEAWYIIEPPPCGFLLAGLKDGVNREDFEKAVQEKRVLDVINKLPVKKGDVVYIPAGLVHALTKGSFVLEIQQNSDTTYRVFDYGRKGADGRERELHIDQALNVINFDIEAPKIPKTGISVASGQNAGRTVFYSANNHFGIVRHDITEITPFKTDGGNFFIFTVIEGGVNIAWKDGSVNLEFGRSVFIPAAFGEFTVSPVNGRAGLIKSFVPDIRKDFVEPLISHDFSLEDIQNNTDIIY